MLDGIRIKLFLLLVYHNRYQKSTSAYTKIDFQESLGVWGEAPFHPFAYANGMFLVWATFFTVNDVKHVFNITSSPIGDQGIENSQYLTAVVL